MSLKDHTLFITGASRGIGLAIALRAARDGANIAIAAKTDKPHPKLTGTIFTAANEITKAGGKALPLVVDVRDETQVKDAIEQTIAAFGRLDIVVNNASAVQRTPVVDTDMRRFDLMHQVNTRGTLMVSKYAIPHLETAKNPHILMNSPPLDFKEKWFAGSTGYSIAKYGMSLVVLGLAGELRGRYAEPLVEDRVGRDAALPRQDPPAPADEQPRRLRRRLHQGGPLPLQVRPQGVDGDPPQRHDALLAALADALAEASV